MSGSESATDRCPDTVIPSNRHSDEGSARRSTTRGRLGFSFLGGLRRRHPRRSRDDDLRSAREKCFGELHFDGSRFASATRRDIQDLADKAGFSRERIGVVGATQMSLDRFADFRVFCRQFRVQYHLQDGALGDLNVFQLFRWFRGGRFGCLASRLSGLGFRRNANAEDGQNGDNC